MQVTDRGTKLELDCASVSIEGAIGVDKEGALRAKGAYLAERPGPQREGEETKPRPSLLTGKLGGKEMTLTLALEDTHEEIGTFTLVLGQSGILHKCQ